MEKPSSTTMLLKPVPDEPICEMVMPSETARPRAASKAVISLRLTRRSTSKSTHAQMVSVRSGRMREKFKGGISILSD